MTCLVCGAPALPYRGACVFCRSPLEAEPDPTGLLDYIAGHLPEAKAQRGLLGRGPVSSLTIKAGGREFRGRLRKEVLVLEPPQPPPEWCEAVLAALRLEAASDHDLRRRLARSGWDFSPR